MSALRQKILAQDLKTILAHDPKAFDCLILPAIPGQEETVAGPADPVGSIDASERKQKFGEPVLARPLIVPEEGLGFEVLAGEGANSFLGVNEPMNLLFSMPVNDFPLSNGENTPPRMPRSRKRARSMF